MGGSEPYMNHAVAMVCLLLLGVFVTILNVFAIFILFKSGKHSRNYSYPLLWLLAANVLIGVFPLPIYGLKKYNFTSASLVGNICDAWRYTYFPTIHLAMASLLIMTVDKVINLQFPLKYPYIITKLRLNLCVLLTWLFFIFFDMIPFFPVNKTDDENCHYNVKKEWAVAMNILTAAVPLPLIVSCYIYMVVLAFKQAFRMKSKNRGNFRTTSLTEKLKVAIEVKATKKVTYIVTAYMICWLPSTLYYLLEWICPKCYPDNYEPHKTWIRFFFKLLVLCHGLVTPILFCWQSKIFRANVRKYCLRNREISKIRGNSGSSKKSLLSRKDT